LYSHFLHSPPRQLGCVQSTILSNSVSPLQSEFVSQTVISSIACVFKKSSKIGILDSHGAGRRGRATGPGDGAGRQPRATATGDSHGRRGRATGPGDGGQLDSHGRQPRATIARGITRTTLIVESAGKSGRPKLFDTTGSFGFAGIILTNLPAVI